MPKFENFDRWVEEKHGSWAGLAERLGVSKNTVSLWRLGKSQIKGKWEKKIRALGYDGPLPKPAEPVTAEDLQALGRDLMKHADQHRTEIGLQIQTLAVAVARALELLGAAKETPKDPR
jgi:transcriptional regulator with XRE-family HTH domain